MVKQGCDSPDCDCSGEPIYFRQACHPDERTDVQYFQGEIVIECSLCQQPVFTIAVARN